MHYETLLELNATHVRCHEDTGVVNVTSFWLMVLLSLLYCPRYHLSLKYFKRNEKVLKKAPPAKPLLYLLLPSQVDSLLVIDGPWSWAAQQLENPFLSGLKRVRLTTNGRRTAYWRYPPLRGAASNFNPTAVLQCMSTVEAIHQCCLEIDGEGGARGLYDNLLWLFAFQYSTVSRALRENPSRMQRVVRKSRGVLNPERFGH